MSDPTQLPRLPRFTICGLGEVRSRSRESTFSHVVSIWDVGTRGDGPAEAAFFPPVGFIRCASMTSSLKPGVR
jgi:hypothetical protein